MGKIIHADLSEFNIVNTGDELVIIDWGGSAVKANHPNAIEFLLRDIENINRYFSKEFHVKTLDGKALLNALLRRYEYKGDVRSDEDGWLLINGKKIIEDL